MRKGSTNDFEFRFYRIQIDWLAFNHNADWQCTRRQIYVQERKLNHFGIIFYIGIHLSVFAAHPALFTYSMTWSLDGWTFPLSKYSLRRSIKKTFCKLQYECDNTESTMFIGLLWWRLPLAIKLKLDIVELSVITYVVK